MDKDRAVQGGEMYDSHDVPFNRGDIVKSSPHSVSRGWYPGAKPLVAYGERTTTVAENNYPIWPNGSVLNVPAEGGIQMQLASTSANDSAAGSNVQSVEIHYLDSSFIEKSEIVTLNGLTPALTTATDIQFVQCLHLQTQGGTPEAAGTITAENVGGGTIYSLIDPGEVRCSSAFRMVPANKILYIDGAAASSISGTADAKSLIRIVATEIDVHQYTFPHLFMPQASIAVQNNGVSQAFPVQPGFKTGTIVGATHTTDKGATIALTWFGTLEPAEDRGAF